LIAAVLLQSGKSAGLSGAIAGGAETFFGKKKGVDQLLSKVTVVLAIVFGLMSLILTVW
jgi:preprotein translocase subunit SecG